jgi:hypothetical protein
MRDLLRVEIYPLATRLPHLDHISTLFRDLGHYRALGSKLYFFAEFLKTAQSMHCFVVHTSSENGQK